MGRYEQYQRKLKYITVLGSTGSIGTQTLEIASEQPDKFKACLLYTSPSPRDQLGSRMPSSA